MHLKPPLSTNQLSSRELYKDKSNTYSDITQQLLYTQPRKVPFHIDSYPTVKVDDRNNKDYNGFSAIE